MKMRSDKKPSRKHDRKVLMAEESTKSWADSDSESSSSSSSSRDSEQEEVHCLMADQMVDDEVFDFSNVEFTREDLVTALNDMVKEYRKLSHSFEEVKAENADLKNSSVESSAVDLGARQEGKNNDDLQILRLNELKKTVMAQGVTTDTDSLAVRNRFNALDAKILLLYGQVAAIRSKQLEFQAKIAADLLSLSTQIGDLVEYIRGGDAKKGEGTSRGPQPSPVDQNRGSGNTGAVSTLRPSDIIEGIIDTDRRASAEDSLRAKRERDRARRERRLSRSEAYKRRRGLLVIFRRREQCIRRKYLSVSVKTAKQRLNKSKRQRIEISQPDESYSNVLNQSQDRTLELDASYSALETVAVYSGLQNQTQETVNQTEATVKSLTSRWVIQTQLRGFIS
ncbi:hypothetical protein F511_25539 [Dorcoceras hygrometricum]|uniref:Uncharacterized protein n=1 Tax=Dorcoceras hygrometricum TaxID=472368 RepID=A0A2Z7A309_9LAMI|nr:hypothetical protein F511_25539 [Dorcoceras hygrometricum]